MSELIDDPLDIFEQDHAELNAAYHRKFIGLFVFEQGRYKLIFEEIAVEVYQLLFDLVICEDNGIPPADSLEYYHSEVFNFMRGLIAEQRRMHSMEVEHGL